MADHREGLYWRADHERGPTAWFGGLEIENTNVRAAPKVKGLIKTSGFIVIGQSLNLKTSISGSIRTGVERQVTGAPTPGAQIRKLQLFLDRQFIIGKSHFGARWLQRASKKKPEEQIDLFWEHAWLDNGSNNFKTSLGVAHLTRGDEDFDHSYDWV
jgi:hypothetical protein